MPQKDLCKEKSRHCEGAPSSTLDPVYGKGRSQPAQLHYLPVAGHSG